MTKSAAILLLLRCLNTEPELCPAADRAIQGNPELAQFSRSLLVQQAAVPAARHPGRH
ncbi:MAG: hypothetical protein U1E34_09180 [Amaricoccus sp.]